jgi:hypothetical protein
MRKDSAHARNHDLSAAAEIFTNCTYFPNALRILRVKGEPLENEEEQQGALCSGYACSGR